MKCSYLFLFLLLLLLDSCRDYESQTFDRMFEYNKDALLSDVYWFPHDSLYFPNWIQIIDDDNILFSNANSSYLLSNYNRKMRVFDHFLKIGYGKKRVSNVYTMGEVNTSDLMISLCDTVSKSLSVVNIGDSRCIMDEEMELPDNICSIAYDSTYLFFVNFDSENHYTIKNIETGETKWFGHEVASRRLYFEGNTNVVKGPCIASSVNKRVAWFSIFDDIFEIYDYREIENIYLVRSNITSTRELSDEAVGERTKIGVFSLATDDKYIYALYNREECNNFLRLKNGTLYSSEILMFDWSGIPYKKVKLNRKIKSIAYSKADQALFCIGLDDKGVSTLYQLDLK